MRETTLCCHQVKNAMKRGHANTFTEHHKHAMHKHQACVLHFILLALHCNKYYTSNLKHISTKRKNICGCTMTRYMLGCSETRHKIVIYAVKKPHTYILKMEDACVHKFMVTTCMQISSYLKLPALYTY